MKRAKRFLLTVGCIGLLALSWLAAVSAKTDRQRQEELIAQAEVYLADEIYVRAVPLLEEAAGYQDIHTLEAEERLKDVYLCLLEQSGYARKYTNLLEKQMSRQDAQPEVFQEAAEYYEKNGQIRTAISLLHVGAEKTGSQKLAEQYEDIRYTYEFGRDFYQEVSEIYEGSVQVKKEGAWGIASGRGSLVIPCIYDAVSTFSQGQAVVYKDGKVSAVNSDNNRVALFHGGASEFGNFGENRVGLHTPEGWVVADGEFHTGGLVLEALGMYQNGCAPAKFNGKWGLLAANGAEWVLPAEYDGIIQDGLGRCFSQDAVFVRQGDRVVLLVEGEPAGDIYEDAQPFQDGWAAVKKDGKWGFIDTTGDVQIAYQFEDALSFSGHLAAVKSGDRWGYVSLQGNLVIPPEFLEAKSFSQGNAPVKTEDGWRFLRLLEFEEGAAGLL